MYIRFWGDFERGVECVWDGERLKETFTVCVRVPTLFVHKVDITFCFPLWKINTSTQGIHMTYTINSFRLSHCLWRLWWCDLDLTPEEELPLFENCFFISFFFFCFCLGQSCNSSSSFQNMQTLSTSFFWWSIFSGFLRLKEEDQNCAWKFWVWYS